MYSLWCAREILDDDFLLLESDIIYEDRALAALLDSPEDSIVLLSDSTDSSDPVHVETQAGLLVAMSKDRAKLGEEIAGELVGVSKISRDLLVTMTAIMEESLLDRMTWHYEEDGLAAARRMPVHCSVLAGLAFFEIDDEHDIAVARSHALGKIAERDRDRRAAERRVDAADQPAT